MTRAVGQQQGNTHNDGFGRANPLVISSVRGQARLLAFPRVRRAPRAVETRPRVWESAPRRFVHSAVGIERPLSTWVPEVE